MSLAGTVCRVCLGLAIFNFPILFAAEWYDKYLWETPRVTNIDGIATADLVAELQREVDKVLDRPTLAPLRLSYADIPYEAYWLYYERGRIVTTLSYAYPHARLSSRNKSVNMSATCFLIRNTHRMRRESSGRWMASVGRCTAS